MPEVICPLCRGRGLFTDPATGKTSLCGRCGGSGTVPYTPARSRRADPDAGVFAHAAAAAVPMEVRSAVGLRSVTGRR